MMEVLCCVPSTLLPLDASDILWYFLVFSPHSCTCTFDPQIIFQLETLYGAFDEIAKRRKVFKVETIGGMFYMSELLYMYLCIMIVCANNNLATFMHLHF